MVAPSRATIYFLLPLNPPPLFSALFSLCISLTSVRRTGRFSEINNRLVLNCRRREHLSVSPMEWGASAPHIALLPFRPCRPFSPFPSASASHRPKGRVALAKWITGGWAKRYPRTGEHPPPKSSAKTGIPPCQPMDFIAIITAATYTTQAKSRRDLACVFIYYCTIIYSPFCRCDDDIWAIAL